LKISLSSIALPKTFRPGKINKKHPLTTPSQLKIKTNQTFLGAHFDAEFTAASTGVDDMAKWQVPF
jgi:hypothetical protein